MIGLPARMRLAGGRRRAGGSHGGRWSRRAWPACSSWVMAVIDAELVDGQDEGLVGPSERLMAVRSYPRSIVIDLTLTSPSCCGSCCAARSGRCLRRRLRTGSETTTSRPGPRREVVHRLPAKEDRCGLRAADSRRPGCRTPPQSRAMMTGRAGWQALPRPRAVRASQGGRVFERRPSVPTAPTSHSCWTRLQAGHQRHIPRRDCAGWPDAAALRTTEASRDSSQARPVALLPASHSRRRMTR